MNIRSIPVRTPLPREAFLIYKYTALGSDGQGPKGFSFIFLDLFDFLIFLLTWREHAWVSWSVRRGRARSCEYVWIAQSHTERPR